ncbi:beta-phosphoglucomutase-like phosphatase (HAD superfamily) [Pseudomonas baetica]|uniref:phosphoglycolate phosphatase n=1 Tax=Pseudomonas baetica TaxID=674054 RepID=A0ABX4Q6P4_9PSED|nr:HAD hydrolase-like protein [Pseudomonas baetica]PKA72418.1 beta-phosphoglucomutase-like phosphatase (HAD superfamily) [Pseudomonas baetica]PTC17130.1 hypothetical protein C0J26_24720 [Pseudomonas baetica]
MVDLIIFDLDNTLVKTDDLIEFRGKENVNVSDEDYLARLRAKATSLQRRILSSDFFIKLSESLPSVQVAVVTRSPRAYARELLNIVYPEIKWAAIVGYEDVDRPKPQPDGLYLAAKHAGVDDREKVILVGDDVSDADAAYRGGCWFVLSEVGLAKPSYAARNRIPDAIVKKENTLLRAITSIKSKLPWLEKVVLEEPLDENYPERVCATSHFTPDGFGEPGKPFRVLSLGRLFAEHQATKNKREWHLLTDEILKYKDTDTFPQEWAVCVRDAMQNQISALRESEGFLQRRKKYKYEVIVTVAPSKLGRKPRMENFLAYIEEANSHDAISDGVVSFAPTAFKFSDAAKSHHGEFLNGVQRFENVRDCLSCENPEQFDGKVVFVLDDVVTTGATLFFMDKICRDNGAVHVICVCLAQTISIKDR